MESTPSPRSSAPGRGVALLLLMLTMIGLAATPAAAAGERTLQVPVLMYHRISAPPAGTRLPDLWVAPGRFGAQLRALHRRGWRTITARELAQAVRHGRSVGPRRFVITFDDGARDGYRNAAPIMERYGMRGTFCVTPGRAQQAWQISFGQMRDLIDRGHEIANHSWDHADLTSISSSALRHQVRGAARLIAQRTGQAPRSFCYPFGRQDAAARREVRASGHRIAFTTVEGAAASRGTAMRTPRIRVNGSTSAAALLSRVRPYAHGGGSEPDGGFRPAASRVPSGAMRRLRSAMASTGAPQAPGGPTTSGVLRV